MSIPTSASSAPPASSTAPLRLRFIFRARIIGIFEWVCPCCGAINASRLRPRSYVVRCRQYGCERLFGVGHVLHVLPPGPRSIPDDYLIPQTLREAFPEGDAGRFWKSGRLMHCVHTESGTLAVPETQGSAEAAQRED